LGDTNLGYQTGESFSNCGSLRVDRMRFAGSTLGPSLEQPTYLFGGQNIATPFLGEFPTSTAILMVTAKRNDASGSSGSSVLSAMAPATTMTATMAIAFLTLA